MKKNLLIAAIAITALASCTSNDYVGDQSPQGSNETNGAISFDMSTPAVTRANITGSDAADLLKNNFVVFGYKTMGTGGSATTQTVFDNYQVNYVTNTASTSESNSADWEYVGYNSKLATPVAQTIKYWDFNAGSYDFFAYSLGGQNATASVMTTNSTYTLTGNITQLGACYISKKTHIAPPSSNTPEVNLEFINFLSKIQLKFFETIPGYSVKDVRFYIAADTKSTGSSDGDGLAPALYGAANSIKRGGQYTITFDEKYNPVVVFDNDAGITQDSKVQFEDISSGVYLNGFVGKEYNEAEETVYLGRAANAATSTKQISVIPNPTGATLTLKMDYTLVSRDGTGETIQVTGATATLPAAFTQWKPNYAYTYIFKITDDKLVPITLDAIVTDAQDGSQETITTVSDPSITTYANKSAVTTDNEYKTSSKIYVVVNNGVTLTTTGDDINAKLYTATIEDGAAQGITEETVANAIAQNTDKYGIGTTLASGTSLSGYYTFNGTSYVACDANTTVPENDNTIYYKPATYSVKDANGKKLVVNNAAESLTAFTEIPANDSPTGATLTIKGATFTPASAGYYVFEYTDGSSNKYYKVIKVVAQ